MRNIAKTWRNASVIIACAGLALTVAGIWMDSMDTMWMIMVGLMIAITFFICIGVFARQAKNLDELICGKGLLAHFTYGQEAEERIQSETVTRKKSNRAILGIIGLFFAALTILFAVFGFDSPKDALWFIILMACVFCVIALAALLTPRFYRKKAQRSPHEALIGVRGAWALGEYVVWDTFLTRLTSVGLLAGEGGLLNIGVTYMRWQRRAWQVCEFRIPVPRGKELLAQKTVHAIAQAHGLKPNL
jgi:hypothetical protein